jgi:hypothetical protein
MAKPFPSALRATLKSVMPPAVSFAQGALTQVN